jgi:hypothetical protein
MGRYWCGDEVREEAVLAGREELADSVGLGFRVEELKTH